MGWQHQVDCLLHALGSELDETQKLLRVELEEDSMGCHPRINIFLEGAKIRNLSKKKHSIIANVPPSRLSKYRATGPVEAPS